MFCVTLLHGWRKRKFVLWNIVTLVFSKNNVYYINRDRIDRFFFMVSILRSNEETS